MKRQREILNYLKKGEEIDLFNLEPEVLGIIGIELKRRRIQQSRTLDSFACGCSISYISKIENGRIHPKYSILQELCDEQGITKEELDCLIKVNILIDEALISTFYGRYQEVEDCCKQFEKFDNYKVNLLRALNYLNKQNYDEVLKAIEAIELVADKLTNLDYNIFIYVKMMLLLYQEKFLAAHKLYFMIKNIDNQILNALCYNAYFKAICYCCIENPTQYYNILCEKYNELLSIDLKDINKLYFETLVKLNFQLPEVIIAGLEKYYQIAYAYLQHDVDRLNYYFEGDLSDYERLLVGMAIKDYDAAYKILLKMDFTKLNKRDELIAKFCKSKINGDMLATNQYLVNYAIPYAEERGDFSLLMFFMKYYSEVALCTGKYKSVATLCVSVFNLLEEYKRKY